MRQFASALPPSRRLLLEVLRDQAGTAGQALPEADPSEIGAELGRQRLLVTLGPALPHPPPALAEVQAAAQRRAMLFEGTTERTIRAIEGAGIPVVTLKGVALAKGLFGDSAAREVTDVDLLVARSRLEGAIAALAPLGWHDPELGVPHPALPPLHRELFHAKLPPVELHWRVHWYEESFCEQALGRSLPGNRLAPADELVCLLLFMARDGFTGLRQVTDVAGWWKAHAQTVDAAEAVAVTADLHPGLRPALQAASTVAEAALALPARALYRNRPPLGRRPRLVVGLADPWLDRPAQQRAAEVSLADPLLAPRGHVGAALRRQLMPSRRSVLIRRPDLVRAPAARLWTERALHPIRVLGRYALGLWAHRRFRNFANIR